MLEQYQPPAGIRRALMQWTSACLGRRFWVNSKAWIRQRMQDTQPDGARGDSGPRFICVMCAALSRHCRLGRFCGEHFFEPASLPIADILDNREIVHKK
jgi:hypothetical protein